MQLITSILREGHGTKKIIKQLTRLLIISWKGKIQTQTQSSLKVCSSGLLRDTGDTIVSMVQELHFLVLRKKGKRRVYLLSFCYHQGLLCPVRLEGPSAKPKSPKSSFLASITLLTHLSKVQPFFQCRSS